MNVPDGRGRLAPTISRDTSAWLDRVEGAKGEDSAFQATVRTNNKYLVLRDNPGYAGKSEDRDG